jgi:hypothetical protein
VSQVVQVDSFAALQRRLKSDLKQKQKQFEAATRKTAREGVTYVRRNIPVAFGELRSSLHAEKSPPAIVADAPHAAPVETGSRPHWPPFAPILRWVQFRGIQGRLAPKRMKRLPGTTTAGAAQSIAGQLGSRGEGAEGVARAIQASIAKKGTKPHWYMRQAIPDVRAILARNMDRVAHGAPSGEGG